MKNKSFYIEPVSEELLALISEIICTSPGEGAIEGTEDEDWVF